MKTALLAFDSKQFNLILSKMLGDLGFFVITTLNFDEAVSLCDEKHPDALFLDWVFDKKDTSELLKKITFHPSVVFVSANAKKNDIEQALNLGAKEYIMKPFDNDILQSKLSMAGLV